MSYHSMSEEKPVAALRRALAAETDAHEIYRLARRADSVSFAAGRFEGVDSARETALAIRAVRRGRVAFAVTGSPGRPAALAREIADLCAMNERRPLRFRSNPVPPDEALAAHEHPALAGFAPADLAPELSRIVRRLRRAVPGAAVGIDLSRHEERIDLANSAGHSAGYLRRGLSAALKVDLARPGDLLELAVAREGASLDELDLPEAVDALAEKARRAARPVPFASGRMPVVFSPQALGDILCALEAGLSGMALALGLTPLKNRLGERIVSERFTLLEDPFLAGSYRSVPFDDEGTPVARRALIERGVLKGFLHTVESARMAGGEPTGNALRMKPIFESRDARARPRVSRTNLVVPPGDAKLDDLIAGVKDGLYADTVIGSFIGNVVTGHFSGNLWLGFRIRDGRLDGRVKNALITGDIYDILGPRLVALSRETPHPAEQRSARLPWCLADGVAVSCA